jgi:glycosylphosphatidylinositol transamidase (GPIT) subunit GPI8
MLRHQQKRVRCSCRARDLLIAIDQTLCMICMMQQLATGLIICLFLALAVTHASHNNNWAVLVSTSRYWFNYRHLANTLSIYRIVRELGIPDNQIILMLPDDMACQPRAGQYPATIYNNRDHEINIYGLEDDIEVDYRGTDVNVEMFLRLLTNRNQENLPKSKRLLTDSDSNILIYMAGHGGDEFIKFNDQEEVSSTDLAQTFKQMFIQQRYNSILMMVDTCQASTLFNQFNAVDTPNMITIGSSGLGENSYSHHTDTSMGVSVIDRFTYHTLEFFQKNKQNIRNTMVQTLFSYYQPHLLLAKPHWKTLAIKAPLDHTALIDYFGAFNNIYARKTSSKYYIIPANNTQVSYEASEQSNAVHYWNGLYSNVDQLSLSSTSPRSSNDSFYSRMFEAIILAAGSQSLFLGSSVIFGLSILIGAAERMSHRNLLASASHS